MFGGARGAADHRCARKHGIAADDILPAFNHPVRVRPSPLHAIRDAVTQRAATERRVAEAVIAAHGAGVSWSVIGGMLGTSGEAARKRYGGRRAESA